MEAREKKPATIRIESGISDTVLRVLEKFYHEGVKGTPFAREVFLWSDGENEILNRIFFSGDPETLIQPRNVGQRNIVSFYDDPIKERTERWHKIRLGFKKDNIQGAEVSKLTTLIIVRPSGWVNILGSVYTSPGDRHPTEMPARVHFPFLTKHQVPPKEWRQHSLEWWRNRGASISTMGVCGKDSQERLMLHLYDVKEEIRFIRTVKIPLKNYY